MIRCNKQKLKECQPTVFSYKTANDEELKYYAFFPENTPKYVVICIHGGGWRSCSAEWLFMQAAYFAENGAVGVSIDYRLLSDETDIRDGLYDCSVALSRVREMVKEKYGKDLPTVVLGDSAGGYYACCMGNQKIMNMVNPAVKIADVVIDLNGIVDLTGKWSYGIIGAKDEGLLRSYSPLFNVTEGDAFVYIAHGDQDKTVAIEDALNYHNALNKQGVLNRYVIVSGAAHAFILFDYTHTDEFVQLQLENIVTYLEEMGLFYKKNEKE